MLWAASSAGPVDPYGNSTALGSASRLLGAPRPGAAKRTTCGNDWGTLTWVPTLPTPRWVAVRFAAPSTAASDANGPATPTINLSSVRRLGVYVLNLGPLSPAITRIDLLLLPEAEAASAETASISGAAQEDWPLVEVPVYLGSAGASDLQCPALNWIAVEPKAVARAAAKAATANSTAAAGATARAVSKAPQGWVVVGARLSASNAPVDSKAQLPQIHALGLEWEVRPPPAGGGTAAGTPAQQAASSRAKRPPPVPPPAAAAAGAAAADRSRIAGSKGRRRHRR